MLDELELELCGKTYHVRPTFAVIMAIERRTNRSVLAILASGSKGVRMTDIACVVYEAARHAGCKMKFDEVGEAIMEHGGFVAYAPFTAQFLAGAISAGPERVEGELPSGDKKSGPEKAAD